MRGIAVAATASLAEVDHLGQGTITGAILLMLGLLAVPFGAIILFVGRSRAANSANSTPSGRT
jgi:hypothetical protein